MSLTASQRETLDRLLFALRDDELTQPVTAQLEQLVLGDAEAMQHYLRVANLNVGLRWMTQEEGSGFRVQDSELGIRDSGFGVRESEFPVPRSQSSPEPLIAPIIIVDHSPTGRYPLTTSHHSLGNWLVSYAAATVITGMAILGAWVYKVSVGGDMRVSSVHVATTNQPPSLPAKPERELIGQITGTAGCRWADPQEVPSAAVPLGRKYELASGLVEISYQSGAKVILQGPCTYEVDSPAGGFLSFGKLTARVEKSEIQNPKSEISGPSPLSPLPSPLFVVRTPTAVVTDLGTEFGVEVERSGATRSHVFCGRIEVRPAAGTSLHFPAGRGAGGEGTDQPVIQLGVNEWVRVELEQNQVVRVTRGAAPSGRFARRMPENVPIKLFNTGAGLDEGQPDPHWQLVARSDDPHFKPRAAVVATIPAGMWLANELSHSQWIAMSNDSIWAPDNVTYTFRTAFDLADAIAETAAVQGWFIADNYVTAIRINGKDVSVPKRVDADLPFGEFRDFTPFSIKGGFVEGVNTLEIDVRNERPGGAGKKTTSPMGLRAELRGFALGGSRTPAADSGSNTPGIK